MDIDIDWLAPAAALFLAPGGVALGSMGLALATGAADVAMRRRSPVLRWSGIFGAALVAAVIWSAMIAWIALHTISATSWPAWPIRAVAAASAVAPSFLFLAESWRDPDVERQIAAALALAAAINGGLVVAALAA